MMGFTFNEIHSSFFDIYIKTLNPPLPPTPRFKEVKVIGKDGSYKFPDGFEDIPIQVEIFLLGNINVRREKLREIGTWLTGEHILRLDYDENVEYKAVLMDISSKEFEAGHEIVRLTFSASLEV